MSPEYFQIQIRLSNIILIISKAGYNNLEEYILIIKHQTSNQTSKKGDEQISSQECLYSRKANNQISSRSEIYGDYGTFLERRIRLTINKTSPTI